MEEKAKGRGKDRVKQKKSKKREGYIGNFLKLIFPVKVYEK